MMEIKLDGCRLCLEELSSASCHLENPDLQEQMKNVFYFPIEPKSGCSSSVCSTCTFVIAEFYQYAEKVRQNQDNLSIALSTDVNCSTNTESLIKSEPLEQEDGESDLPLEPKQEMLTDSDNFSDMEVFADSYELPTKRRRCAPRKKQSRKGKEKKIKTENEGCSRKQKNKEQIEQEDKTLNDFFQMICELCEHKAENFKLLLSHFKEIHLQPGYVVCCKKKIYRRFKLVQHMQTHISPDGELCEICNKSYKNLRMHRVAMHAKQEDKHFKCDRCPKEFSQKGLLRAHLMRHEKVQCPHCDMMLSNSQSLAIHIINKHSNVDRRMICDACGQEFLNKLCFDRHVKEHMGIEVHKKLQCHICQKWLKGERGLQKHLQFSHYERAQTHECDVCHQQYPNSRALFDHKRLVHVRAKFECDFCGKQFKRASNLKEHRTIHTGERLYSCDYCGTSMNSKANLYTHVKKTHPTEWAEKKRLADESRAPKSQS
ncbi:transcription factor grauzone-like [Uranotaenia lowii]|uniref:transcription factor grauzone-like n=1 Tax=Uranotaenia lowii TaxID=190385 RepID=UPI00247A231B|nr:transcription factor grauzone-like [Uranotaenia lowii]